MGVEASPTISAIIPTYNRATQVGRAIESVLAQERPADEIVVVDDGSTDGTPSVLREFGARIRVLTQANAGASGARNQGVKAAKGSWIAFLDSDDTWAPRYLRMMDEAIRTTGAAAVLYFADALFEADGGEKSAWEQAGFKGRSPYMMMADPAGVLLGEVQPALLPFCVIRRSSLIDAGGFWGRLSTTEDTHMLLKLGLRHPFCSVALKGGLVRGSQGASDRLTGQVGPDTTEHWMNAVRLWADLIRTAPSSGTHRPVMRLRLAEAHWRLARISMREHRTAAAIVNLLRSVLTDPKAFGRALSRRVGVRGSPGSEASKT